MTKKVIEIENLTIEELTAALASSMKREFQEMIRTIQPQSVEYISRTELRDLLKVDLSTIHNWTKKGILKPFQIGGRVYYLRSDIDKQMISISHEPGK